MSGVELATAYISLVPSAAGIAAGIAKEMGGPLESAAADAGDAASKSFGEKFKSGLASAAKIAAVGLGVAVAAFAGLESIGSSFDDAYDTIAVKTGATGELLGDLEQSFKDVVQDVPVDFGDASVAIAGLNTRLGLTGGDLEATAKQFLNLSRITGEDLGTSIESVTRVFGDWGISVDDQGARMDQLFKTSQLTGIGVNQLSDQLVSTGAPMRQLGFTMEESAALFGKWNKEGVNSEAIMSGVRKAISTFAQEGKDIPSAFQEAISTIQGMESASDATAKAIEIFGAKAGPDMAAAIREGRFEIADLVGQIGAAEGTINDTASSTDDWREKLTLLKNKALIVLEPIAAKVFGAIGSVVEWATPYVQSFAEWLGEKLPVAAEAVQRFFDEKVVPAFQAVSGWVVDHWPQIREIAVGVFDAIKTAVSYFVGTIVPSVVSGLQATFGFLVENKPALAAVATVIGAVLVVAIASWATATWAQVSALWAQAAAFAAAYAPIVAIIAVIAALAAGVVYAYTHWEWFRNVVDNVASFFKDTVWPILQNVFGWLRDNVPPIIDAIARFVTEKMVPAFQSLWQFLSDNVFPIFQTIGSFLYDFFRIQVEAVITVVTTLWDWFGILWDRSEGLRGFLADAFVVGLGIAKAAFDTIVTIATTTWQVIQTVWDKTEGLRSLMAVGFSLALAGATTAWNVMKTAIDLVWGAIQTVWDKTEGLRDFLAGAFALGMSGAKVIWDGFLTVATGIWNMVKNITSEAGRALAALNSLNPFDTTVTGVNKIGQLPGNAGGTDYWRGGPTWVGEKGPELIWANKGAMIQPAQESAAFTRQLFRGSHDDLTSGSSPLQQAGRTAPLVGTVEVHNDTDADGFLRMLNFHEMAGGLG